MRTKDLGVLDGPVLLFGGPYSNLQATDALIRQAQARAIPPTHMICTGDVTAYCADPAATVTRIRALGCPVVAGNCETQLAAGEADCGCGFEEGSVCDALSAEWYRHASARVSAEDRAWMADLPDMATFTHQGRRVAVIHGGAMQNNRFLWPTDPDTAFAAEISKLPPVDVVIAGHCGMAFERSINGVRWINAGCIGMPRHDGDPRTEFAVLDGAATVHRLTYDHAAAARAMAKAGLSPGYRIALETGWWPSEDVLPSDLRRCHRTEISSVACAV